MFANFFQQLKPFAFADERPPVEHMPHVRPQIIENVARVRNEMMSAAGASASLLGSFTRQASACPTTAMLSRSTPASGSSINAKAGRWAMSWSSSAFLISPPENPTLTSRASNAEHPS